ncbi:dihydroorotate dehydrogenase [Mycobacterium liflandii 128FXT]|uniref:Dihydroorotate dehydrogenase n=1 Tax=Mycobacterium liflandii (strain 128FXT) TaxID=459424 RepID=L7V692_MYCL1|nr:dihydroorotate dehydrogenase-like protein [Mycobacterium ulcerans]AGC63321.1 dihydroorotate dehydrogenase [Mycobacterium liflandii 128FXT]
MDLSTTYLGLSLRSPLLASASPLSQTLHGVRALADAGVGAVVLYSLFEEQLRREAEQNELMAAQGSESSPESLSYFPPAVDVASRAQRYLRLIERASASVDIPIIGSLNASTPGNWARYAHSMQEAGAAAIELNIYYLPGDTGLNAHAVEQRHLEVLDEVKTATTVPVAVKLSPYFSATADMAHRLDAAGADGLVLFNRFLQPDIDPETLSLVRGITLSTPGDTRLGLTWISLLHGRTRASLAATTGVEHASDVAKYLARRGGRRANRVSPAALRTRVCGRVAPGVAGLAEPQRISGSQPGARAAGGSGHQRVGGARACGLRLGAAQG